MRARVMFCLRFIFFSFVDNYIQTLRGWCHHQPIIGHFSALFVISPLRSRAFCQVSKLTILREHCRLWEMFIWSKLGQNPSDIYVGTFARIKNLIWDQLLATKANYLTNCPELSYIFVFVQNRRWFCKLKFLFLLTFEKNIQCAKQGVMSGVSRGMRWR